MQWSRLAFKVGRWQAHTACSCAIKCNSLRSETSLDKRCRIEAKEVPPGGLF